MDSRPPLVRRAILLSVLSVVLSGVTGVTGVVLALSSGSLSLLGFGFDAAIDSAASVALIWRFAVEVRQPHRAARVETLAEALVGATLVVLSIYLVVGSVRSLLGHVQLESSPDNVVLLVFSVIVLPMLARAKRIVANQLTSGALRADSLLTAVAALLAAISLVGIVLSDRLGLWWADFAASLVIAVVVFREGLTSLVSARSGSH